MAADATQPTGIVGLQTSATVEVAKDLMSVTLNTTREGPDAATVQTSLKQALGTGTCSRTNRNVNPMVRAQAMSKMSEDSPLPVEAGKAVVMVTVSGTVQMTK